MSYGQTNEFDKAVLKLSKVKPKNYADIDAILKPFERDSVKMKSATDAFILNEYNEGAS